MENKFKCKNCGCNEYTIEEGHVTLNGKIIKKFVDCTCDRCFNIERKNITTQ